MRAWPVARSIFDEGSERADNKLDKVGALSAKMEINHYLINIFAEGFKPKQPRILMQFGPNKKSLPAVRAFLRENCQNSQRMDKPFGAYRPYYCNT